MPLIKPVFQSCSLTQTYEKAKKLKSLIFGFIDY